MVESSARLFFGVPIPQDAAVEVASALAAGSQHAAGLRFTPPENWHITVRFLGETAAERRAAVDREFSAVRLPPPFSVRLDRWGTFPRPNRAAVFWIGSTVMDGAFSRLNEVAEQASIRAGFDPDPRPYSPHLTLARLRAPVDLRPLLSSLPLTDIVFSVESCVLYRSDSGKGGVKYVMVKRWELPA